MSEKLVRIATLNEIIGLHEYSFEKIKELLNRKYGQDVIPFLEHLMLHATYRIYNGNTSPDMDPTSRLVYFNAVLFKGDDKVHGVEEIIEKGDLLSKTEEKLRSYMREVDLRSLPTIYTVVTYPQAFERMGNLFDVVLGLKDAPRIVGR